MAADLTGHWIANNGGDYYLRQSGSDLWWYAENNPGNPLWTHVARGTIRSNTITVFWSDVPKGQLTTMNKGSFNVTIVSDTELKSGDTEWHKSS